ncbi:uncharacterized protein LOC110210772 [Phascolarctos cinereus]|uniref:Glycophorin-A n=1 Tax=Phascolarctos cinereus TaxID=38626 RepID=A0A6P5KLL3_PHACI|nr:glycophorin-A-like [Phascolarctos cinereus]
MYKEIVLLLLLSGNVSTQELSSNKAYIFLPLTSQKLARHQRNEGLPVTEDPGYISTTAISQKPTRRQRVEELPVTEDPGYVSTQEVSTPHSNASKPYEQPVTKEITTVATASIAKDEHLTTQTHSEISTQAPGKDGSRDRVTHALSGPVIAVVVFATIAGIVGVILFASFLVRRLTRKN